MPCSLNADALDWRTNPCAAVARAGPARLRAIRGGWGLADAKNIGPLLDFFPKIWIAQCGIGGAMPELHPWSWTAVAGKSCPCEVAPLLRRLDQVPVGAGAIPH